MKNRKIVAAFALGCAFVLLALVTSDFGTNNSALSTEPTVRVAQAPERQRIAVTDANNNNIPDWQEQIVPSNSPALTTTLPSDYSTPDTLTGQASIEFFKQFIDVKSGNSFAQSEDAFIEQFADGVVQSAQDITISARDVQTTTNNDPETLRRYVNAVAEIFIAEGFIAAAGDELTILQKALDEESPAALAALEPISTALTRSITRAKTLSVPNSMVQEHVNIINTATSVRNDILGMGQIYDDPMYAFVRLRRYDQDTVAITRAFYRLEDSAIEKGAQFLSTDPINFQ